MYGGACGVRGDDADSYVGEPCVVCVCLPPDPFPSPINPL